MRWARPAQFAVFGSAALFLVVLVTHISTAPSLGELPDWVPKKASSLIGSISNSTLIRGDLQAVLEKSEKLWKKTVDQRHALLAQLPKDMDFFPAHNTPSYFAYPLSVWDLVPASYNCPWEVERIGRMGDGGKWVCGMSRYEENNQPCIIYSFGVQNESSFEQEMLERTNCEIWGYDFSVEEFGPAIKSDVRHRTHFLKAGIEAKTDLAHNPPFYSIQDLMTKNGHDYIDILKIDIEYSEFSALSSLNTHVPSSQDYPIGQMLIELHLFKKEPMTLPAFLDWWEMLEGRGLRAAWTEPNLLAVTVHLEDSQPRLAEYTLINSNDKRNKLFV